MEDITNMFFKIYINSSTECMPLCYEQFVFGSYYRIELKHIVILKLDVPINSCPRQKFGTEIDFSEESILIG